MKYTQLVLQVIRRDVDECSDFSSILGEGGGGAEEGKVDLNAGYIQHCIVEQGFNQIHEYDLYRCVYSATIKRDTPTIVRPKRFQGM